MNWERISRQIYVRLPTQDGKAAERCLVSA